MLPDVDSRGGVNDEFIIKANADTAGCRQNFLRTFRDHTVGKIFEATMLLCKSGMISRVLI